MALTRKFLAAMGIEADKIEEIITAHTESIEGVKSERDKYKEEAEKLPAVQKELDKLKDGDGTLYKTKYEAEHEAFENYKKDVSAKELRSKKETAYREILKDANLSEDGIKKALKYAEWDKIDLDEDGKVKESKAHIKTAQEEWSAYVVKKSTSGAEVSKPPTGSAGKSFKSKEEIMSIKDIAERQKAISENHELFGF